jgi:hypothetical protein
MNAQAVGQDQIENASAIKRIQKHLGLKADGWPGDATWTAIHDALGIETPRVMTPPNDIPIFPNEDFASMVAYYGSPGDEGNLVRFKMPYPMRLYTRSAPANLTSHRCHRKVKDSLEAVLKDLLDSFGLPWITENGLDVYGGCYNFRKKRGGNSYSKHAWGVAIDLNPAENGLHDHWPTKANMPEEAIEVFERHGWKSLGRLIGRDAMHFEATT